MTRPLGWAAYRPRGEAAELIDAVNEILAGPFSDVLPVTVRQVFYRLVARHGSPKEERPYKRLADILTRARRAGLIDWRCLVDSGVVVSAAPHYHGHDDVVDVARRVLLTDTPRDPQEGQKVRHVVFVEAAGMVPQIAAVCHPLGVDVRSSGGFNSFDALVRAAHEFAREDSHVTNLLCIGDYDPSGVHLIDRAIADVAALALRWNHLVLGGRLAVTEDQIVHMRLPTYPAKATDGRSFAGVLGDGVSTAQAEAIDPHEMQRLVVEEIMMVWDEEAAEVAKHAMAVDRASLATLARWI